MGHGITRRMEQKDHEGWHNCVISFLIFFIVLISSYICAVRCLIYVSTIPSYIRYTTMMWWFSWSQKFWFGTLWLSSGVSLRELNAFTDYAAIFSMRFYTPMMHTSSNTFSFDHTLCMMHFFYTLLYFLDYATFCYSLFNTSICLVAWVAWSQVKLSFLVLIIVFDYCCFSSMRLH